MISCPYIELKYHSAAPSVTCTATLCALPKGHGGLHLQQSARELKKWEQRDVVRVAERDLSLLQRWGR